jgi:hypothetical protein
MAANSRIPNDGIRSAVSGARVGGYIPRYWLIYPPTWVFSSVMINWTWSGQRLHEEPQIPNSGRAGYVSF